MNNTVTNKVKPIPHLFVLGPQIALKRKWHYVSFLMSNTTKLDVYVYKFKEDSISSSLLRHNKYLVEFLA